MTTEDLMKSSVEGEIFIFHFASSMVFRLKKQVCFDQILVFTLQVVFLTSKLRLLFFHFENMIQFSLKKKDKGKKKKVNRVNFF